METKAYTPTVWKIEKEARDLAYLMATETLKKEYGEEFAVNEPEKFYKVLDELVEHYKALILAKKLERLPFIKKGRGRPSKIQKKVKEFFEHYGKVSESSEKQKKVKYVVYSWITVKNPAFKEKAIIPTYIGSFTDYETALAEAKEHGGFIVETTEQNPYLAFLREVKAIYQKNSEKISKKLMNKLEQLGTKYGMIRLTWTVVKNIDDYYIIYVPNMPIVFSPEFARKLDRILIREYSNKRALNDKFSILATAIKIKRANVPVIAVKVRKNELQALKRTIGKPLSVNAIRRNAF